MIHADSNENSLFRLILKSVNIVITTDPDCESA